MRKPDKLAESHVKPNILSKMRKPYKLAESHVKLNIFVDL